MIMNEIKSNEWFNLKLNYNSYLNEMNEYIEFMKFNVLLIKFYKKYIKFYVHKYTF